MRRKAEADEIRQLEEAVTSSAPQPGSNPLAEKMRARKFMQLPLSRPTLNGLKQHKFVSMTAIQRATLPHALCGRDVLGGAKTGSGKTLAFLIPVRPALGRLEVSCHCVVWQFYTPSPPRWIDEVLKPTFAALLQLLEGLFRHQWTPEDGLGALVISPTRELALQIFDELRRVGQFHVFSAGLVIGGKDLKAEQEHINGADAHLSEFVQYLRREFVPSHPEN